MSTVANRAAAAAAAFDLTSMRLDLERRMQKLEELFPTKPVVSATSSPTPSASFTSPAPSTPTPATSTTTPPASTSAAPTAASTAPPTVPDAPAAAKAMEEEERVNQKLDLCIQMLRETKTRMNSLLASTTTTEAPPATTTTTSPALQSSASTYTRESLQAPPASCSTPGRTHDESTLLPGKEDALILMPTRCSATCLSHDNIMPMSYSMECSKERYITNNTPAYSSGVQFPCLDTRVWIVHKEYEGIGAQKTAMLELVDTGQRPSTIYFEQICIPPKPPWLLLYLEDGSSMSNIVNLLLPWTYLLVLINNVKLRPIPWPSFSVHKATQLDIAISYSWYGDRFMGLYHDAGMFLHLGIESFLLAVHGLNSSSTMFVNANTEVQALQCCQMNTHFKAPFLGSSYCQDHDWPPLFDCQNGFAALQFSPIPWQFFTSHTMAVCCSVSQFMVKLGNYGECLQHWLLFEIAVQVEGIKCKTIGLSQFSVGQFVYLQKMDEHFSISPNSTSSATLRSLLFKNCWMLWEIPWQSSTLLCWFGYGLTIIRDMQVLWQCYTNEVKLLAFTESFGQALALRGNFSFNASLRFFVLLHTWQLILEINDLGFHMTWMAIFITLKAHEGVSDMVLHKFVTSSSNTAILVAHIVLSFTYLSSTFLYVVHIVIIISEQLPSSALHVTTFPQYMNWWLYKYCLCNVMCSGNSYCMTTVLFHHISYGNTLLTVLNFYQGRVQWKPPWLSLMFISKLEYWPSHICTRSMVVQTCCSSYLKMRYLLLKQVNWHCISTTIVGDTMLAHLKYDGTQKSQNLSSPTSINGVQIRRLRDVEKATTITVCLPFLLAWYSTVMIQMRLATVVLIPRQNGWSGNSNGRANMAHLIKCKCERVDAELSCFNHGGYVKPLVILLLKWSIGSVLTDYTRLPTKPTTSCHVLQLHIRFSLPQGHLLRWKLFLRLYGWPCYSSGKANHISVEKVVIIKNAGEVDSRKTILLVLFLSSKQWLCCLSGKPPWPPPINQSHIWRFTEFEMNQPSYSNALAVIGWFTRAAMMNDSILDKELTLAYIAKSCASSLICTMHQGRTEIIKLKTQDFQEVSVRQTSKIQFYDLMVNDP